MEAFWWILVATVMVSVAFFLPIILVRRKYMNPRYRLRVIFESSSIYLRSLTQEEVTAGLTQLAEKVRRSFEIYEADRGERQRQEKKTWHPRGESWDGGLQIVKADFWRAYGMAQRCGFKVLSQPSAYLEAFAQAQGQQVQLELRELIDEPPLYSHPERTY